MKGCEELKDWVDRIINHFWYCCQVAEGSVEELKVRFKIFPTKYVVYVHVTHTVRNFSEEFVAGE